VTPVGPILAGLSCWLFAVLGRAIHGSWTLFCTFHPSALPVRRPHLHALAPTRARPPVIGSLGLLVHPGFVQPAMHLPSMQALLEALEGGQMHRVLVGGEPMDQMHRRVLETLKACQG